MTEDCCCSSLTAKVAVDTERHSVGGLMDQRPADLESCSEYWSPPNIDVSVLAWETQRKGDKGNRWIVGYLRVRTQWYPRQTNFSFFFFFLVHASVYVSMPPQMFMHLCICVFQRNWVHPPVSSYLVLTVSSQQCTTQACLLHINLLDVRATMWNHCQGITEHSARNNNRKARH